MLTIGILAVLTTPALAWNETTTTSYPIDEPSCGPCHQPWSGGVWDGVAVHGGFTAGTQKCGKCHDVHSAAPAGKILLRGATIQATCFTCHDGTGGKGVYGSIAALGLPRGAAHRCDTTNAVPGGDPSTGGTSSITFGGEGNTLSCDDCHSPHGASVVASFTGDRRRSTSMAAGYTTTKLLKQRPGNSASSTTVYGSEWCGACHKGRLSGGTVHNHPVDSVLTTSTRFYYQNVARLATDTPTSTTVLGTMGITNRGYLMPVPRTPQQAGHSPICQQCHEDSRFVGSLSSTGAPADAATFTINGSDGTNTPTPDNPRFQNFPHETQNARFLVEVNDDLCTNCHATDVLP
jgi:predicted CXXCH cytochrome family protein